MLYGGGWSSAPRSRTWMIVLALGAMLILFMQTRTSPVVVSSWGGAQAGSIKAEARPITGQAAVQSNTVRAIVGVDVPVSDPLGSARVVMTQGYGVGSHAPANVWGAVDLAIDGDGDGQADPGPSLGAPIYATHRGAITITPNSYPAGNHVWVIGDHFKTGYSHLQGFAADLHDGQIVEAGTLIGYIGSTGESSGPHLDYQVWKDGVNVNPLDYGATLKP